MSNTALIMSCSYHFGDTPGVFQDATFIGYTLELPLRLVSILDAPGVSEVFLSFETRDVETWDGGWRGHPVFLGDLEIGRLRDPSDVNGRTETFRFSIEKATMERLIGEAGRVILKILLEKQVAHRISTDDFLLTRIEAVNMALRIG